MHHLLARRRVTLCGKLSIRPAGGSVHGSQRSLIDQKQREAKTANAHRLTRFSRRHFKDDVTRAIYGTQAT